MPPISSVLIVAESLVAYMYYCFFSMVEVFGSHLILHNCFEKYTIQVEYY